MSEKALWVWRLHDAPIALTTRTSGVVMAVDPRDAISRALTSSIGNGRHKGQLLGEALGANAGEVLAQAPDSLKTRCEVDLTDKTSLTVKKVTTNLTVGIRSFGFVNPSGGTGMSNWDHNELFPDASALVQVVEGWDDYEIGFRMIGVSADPKLTAYLERVGSPDDRRVFFGDHEIISRAERLRAIKLFCEDREDC